MELYGAIITPHVREFNFFVKFEKNEKLKMIIVRLSGGMGNQMFQYAAALAAAKRLGTELVLDLAWYNQHTAKLGRLYSLGCFPEIKERHACFRDVRSVFPWQAFDNYMTNHQFFKYLGRRLVKCCMLNAKLLPEGKAWEFLCESDSLLLPIPASRVYAHVKPCYSPRFEAIPDNVYMTGYPCSEKFFLSIAEEVRRKFAFSQDILHSPNLEKIRRSNSVSVHVRRGDKVHEAGYFVSDEEYIRCAVERVCARIENPVFFVFSDDIIWCKNRLPHLYDVSWSFMEGAGGQDAAKDLALMSLCKHNIVGPSTLSWWGAWLNRNPEKIVIAPCQSLWFENSADYYDLLPEDWTTLSS